MLKSRQGFVASTKNTPVSPLPYNMAKKAHSKNTLARGCTALHTQFATLDFSEQRTTIEHYSNISLNAKIRLCTPVWQKLEWSIRYETIKKHKLMCLQNEKFKRHQQNTAINYRHTLIRRKIKMLFFIHCIAARPQIFYTRKLPNTKYTNKLHCVRTWPQSMFNLNWNWQQAETKKKKKRIMLKYISCRLSFRTSVCLLENRVSCFYRTQCIS